MLVVFLILAVPDTKPIVSLRGAENNWKKLQARSNRELCGNKIKRF